MTFFLSFYKIENLKTKQMHCLFYCHFYPFVGLEEEEEEEEEAEEEEEEEEEDASHHWM